MISFECKQCGQEYQVKNDFAGRRLKCKGCDSPIRVPRLDQGRRKPRQRSQKTSKASASDFPNWLMISGIATGTLLLVIPIWMFFGSKNMENGVVNLPQQQNRAIPVNRQPAPPQADQSQTEEEIARNPHSGQQTFQSVAIFNQSGSVDEYRLLKTAPEYEPPTTWENRVDPPQHSLEVFATAQEIEVDRSNNLGIPIEQKVILSEVASTSLAIGGVDEKVGQFSIWNLSAGRKIGMVSSFPGEPEIAAVSSDGNSLLSYIHARKDFIKIDDLRLQKTRYIRFENITPILTNLFMPTENRVIAITRSGGAGVWNLPEKEIALQIDIKDKRSQTAATTITPGGQYLITLKDLRSSNYIQFYDLNNGAELEKINLPYYPVDLNCVGLNVSPDGTTLAALLEGKMSAKILTYSLETGLLRETMTIPLVPSQHSENVVNSKPLAWFANSKRMLVYGNLIIDREVGAVVYKVQEEVLGTYPVGENHLALIYKKDARKNLLRIIPLPTEEIQETIAQIEAERKGNGVPVITLNKNEMVAAPISTPVNEEAVVPWTFTPQPAKPLESREALCSFDSLPVGAQELAMSQSANPIISILSVTPNELLERVEVPFPAGVHHPGDGFREDIPASLIEFINVKTNQVVLQVEAPHETRMIALSPEGHRAVISNSESTQFYLVEVDSGKISASWKVDDEPNTDSRSQKHGFFCNEDHLVSVNDAGGLVCRELPSLKPIFAATDASHAIPLPSQTGFGYYDGRNFNFVDLKTGELTGQVELGEAIGGLSISLDEKFLAVRNETHQATASIGENQISIVEIFNLSEGTSIRKFPVFSDCMELQWIPGNFLLANQEKLIDPKSGTIAWSFTVVGGKVLLTDQQGTVWMSVKTKDGNEKLRRKPILNSKILSTINKYVLPSDFAVTPATPLTVEFSLSGKAANVKQNVQEEYEQQYAAAGIKLQPNSKRILRLSTEESPGKSREYWISKVKRNSMFPLMPIAPFGGGGLRQKPPPGSTKTTVQGKTTQATIQLVINGRVVWETYKTYNNNLNSFSLYENMSAQQACDKSMANSVKRYFTDHRPHPYILTNKSGYGVKTTDFNADDLTE